MKCAKIDRLGQGLNLKRREGCLKTLYNIKEENQRTVDEKDLELSMQKHETGSIQEGIGAEHLPRVLEVVSKK